jgi:hypothetical protein
MQMSLCASILRFLLSFFWENGLVRMVLLPSFLAYFLGRFGQGMGRLYYIQL